MSVSLSQLTNGFELTFQHVGGHIVVAKSDERITIQGGDLFRIDGEGLPKDYSSGDLYLRFYDDNDRKGAYSRIIGNKISLLLCQPCEMSKVKHIQAAKVTSIPKDKLPDERCEQQ
ncbi:hypothetical protein HW132_34890 [Brasilonema sp. CT11]|nr:hypothetical protein [Brasilonema sp. CT11]